MVVRNEREQRVDRLFHALSDATRRDIVRRAVHGELSVSALATRYEMSFAAVQKHVALLAEVGLVSKQRRGRERVVRTEIDTVRDVRRLLDDLEALWRARIDRLGVLLDEPARHAGREELPR